VAQKKIGDGNVCKAFRVDHMPTYFKFRYIQDTQGDEYDIEILKYVFSCQSVWGFNPILIISTNSENSCVSYSYKKKERGFRDVLESFLSGYIACIQGCLNNNINCVVVKLRLQQ